MQEACLFDSRLNPQRVIGEGASCVEQGTIMSGRPMRRRPYLLMYGILLFFAGLAAYLAGVTMALPRHLLGSSARLLALNEMLVWYSGVPVMLGLCLAMIDIFVLLGGKRSCRPGVRRSPLADKRLTVALTAYNDEASIADVVRDFLSHDLVEEVIVISNNSTDLTMQRARAAGATVLNEPRQGYGRCVFRGLEEALTRPGELIIICEGDSTFRAYDIDKFLAYAPHADIVLGTRTVERLRARKTQLSTFMYYGNLFVGKLLEAKHLGRATITDVGTTYKLCRRETLTKLLPHLNPAVDLEFNAHFVDVALSLDYDVVECPITFHPRIGVSKGGNLNNWRALCVGLRMLLGVAWRWKVVAA